MNKYLLTGIILLVLGVIYVGYMLNHPTQVININLYLLYAIYALYLIITFVMIVIGLTKIKK